MAKNYIDNLSEETRKGMLEKAEQSIYPSFAPLGYRNSWDLAERESLSLILILLPSSSRSFSGTRRANAPLPKSQKEFGKLDWFRVGPEKQFQTRQSITCCGSGSCQATSI